MASRFRPLLPAQSSGEVINRDTSEEGQTRRSVVRVACSACQRAKTKCSGDRPTCHRCGAKNIACEYIIEADQTRASARRDVEEQLHDLYTYLQTRSWSEALEILRRIRETPNPVDVVRLVKAGDLLLHKRVADRADTTTMPRNPGGQDPSYIEPSPRPWTTIVNDNTARDLVSVFFEKDQRFLMSFIDRDMFLRDMQIQPQRLQNGWFCSMLLVNAICAITTCHRPLPAGVDFRSGSDLGEAFFTEAKWLLDLEAGKPSLPTAQALLVMFSYCCRMGRDRVGNTFRAAGYEMTERIMPKLSRALSNASYPADQRRALSRALWGMFCFDSICSSVYMRPSLFPAPKVPRPFGLVGGPEYFHSEREVRKLTTAQPHNNPEDMALTYACDLSEIFNKAMECEQSCDRSEGTKTSTPQLAQLYRDLQTLQSTLPGEEHYWREHHYEHCYLRAYHHVVAANIARLLHRWDTQMPSPFTRPTEACVHHCQNIIKHIDQHMSRYPSGCQGSLAAVYFAYASTISLVGLLSTSSSVVQTFSRACQIFHEATEYPLSNLILEGLAAIANLLGVQLPPDTEPYFSKLKLVGKEHGNIPLGFVVPLCGEVLEEVGNSEWDLDPIEAKMDLGDILVRSRASISKS